MIAILSGCHQCLCFAHSSYISIFGEYFTGNFTQGHNSCPKNLQCFWYISSFGPSLLSLQLAGSYAVVLVCKLCSTEQSPWSQRAICTSNLGMVFVSALVPTEILRNKTYSLYRHVILGHLKDHHKGVLPGGICDLDQIQKICWIAPPVQHAPNHRCLIGLRGMHAPGSTM